MAHTIEDQLHSLAEERRARERDDAVRLQRSAAEETRSRERFVEICREAVLPAVRELATAFEEAEPEVAAEIIDRLNLADPSLEVRLRWTGSHRSSTTLDLRWNRTSVEVTIVGSGLHAREVVDRCLDDLTTDFVRERFTMAARAMLGD